MDNNKINEAALTKRLKTLVLQGRYEDALKELEDIDIQRLKNSSVLCLVGEVYIGLKEYNEAERVLLRVYEKNPTARRILDLLTTLYIEKGEYSEAEYYYKEFIGVASKDLHRYILRYRIDKGKHERTSVLIHTLEKLKEYEYIEEWAYELARLYDESGQTKKCLHECDEIILWFGYGEYVDKAIALRCKLTGEPLPEMTTVEKYKAEEEKRAAEQKEKEQVYADISRRSADPVVDGMEDVFDGSIDTEMIQQTLEGRENPADAQKTKEVPETAEEKSAEVPEGAAEEKAEDIKPAEPAETAVEPQTAEQEEEDELLPEKPEDEEEDEDEIIPESELEVPEKEEEKMSITQRFSNLMAGNLFGKLRPAKKEDAAETVPEKAAAAEQEESAEAAETETPAAETGAEAPAAETETEASAEEAEQKEPAEASETETPAAETEPEESSAEEETESEESDEDGAEDTEEDEVLEEELDLSIFEMKADQAFEDSIIQSMDEAMRANFGDKPEEAAEAKEETAEEVIEETTEEVPEEVKEASEETAEEITGEEDAPTSEQEETDELKAIPTSDVECITKQAELSTFEEKSVEEQAASFAEAISEAVGEPSAFISEQTENFELEDTEAETAAEDIEAVEEEAEAGEEAAEEAEPEAEAAEEAEPEAEAAEEAEPEAEAVEPEAEATEETEPEAETVETAEEAEPEAEAAEEAVESEAEDETIDDEDEDEDEIIDEEDEDDEDEIITDGEEADEITRDAFISSLFAAALTEAAGSEEEPAAGEALKEKPEELEEEPEEEPEEEDEFSDSLQASDTVMDIFGAVAEVKSIKQQLTETFTKFEFQDSIDLLAPYDINFVVTGEDMSVKSQIAIGIAKALNTYHICDKNKLVRADAEDLNSRDFASIFPRLKGGCLIIESADKLSEKSIQTISDYIQQENQDVAIVLEGEEKPLRELFSRNPQLRQKFLNIIHIGKYNESELVQLATGYAKKKGYEVAKEAGPVLRHLFSERMKRGESVNYEDIITIVDNAISSLERRNMENLFMTVLDNKYEEAAMFLLQPQDFAVLEEDAEESQ